MHFVNNIIIFEYLYLDGSKYLNKKIEDQDEFAIYIASYIMESNNEEIDKKSFLNSIKKIAKKGNLDAKCFLALAYAKGDLCRINRVKAKELLEDAANKGHARSKAYLGVMLGEDAKSEKDCRLSIDLLHEAVALKDLFAMYFLGNLYLIKESKNLAIKYNKKKGLDLLIKASKQGFLIAKDALATYYKEEGTKESLKKAFKLYEELTLFSYPQSFAHLGECYCEGLGVKANLDKAHELFLKGAELEESLSFYFLSVLYYGCEYIGIDKEKSLEYLKKAAELNYSNAQFLLSIKYEEGEDVELSKEKALELLNTAVKNGNIDAKFYLAGKLLVGEGVRRNIKKGLKYLKELAGKNHKEAQDLLNELMSDEYIPIVDYVE